MTRLTSAHLLVLTVLIGCSGERTPASAHLPVDSAGVEILRLSSLSTASEASAAPLFRIPAEGRPAHLFDVRGLIWVDSTSIAVLNGGAYEIRWYDDNGVEIARAGRYGDGPSEYRDPFALWPGYRGGLSVLDAGRDRELRFGNGQFLDGVPIQGLPTGVLRSAGFTSGGVFLTEENVRVPAQVAMGGGEGRDSIGLFAYRSSDGTVRPVVAIPGIAYESQGGGTWSALYPDRYPAYAGRDSIVVWSPPDELIIQVMNDRGHLLRSVRVDSPIADVAEDFVRPQLFVDDQHRIWTRDFFDHPELSESTGTKTWTVLSSSGIPLFSTALPASFRPYDMRGQELLGIERDSMDVESIHAYRIR